MIDATLFYIMVATACSAALSISLAAWLSLVVLSRLVERMVAFSAGTLLGAALLHMMPEALESQVDAHTIFALLLFGVLGFFLLERFDVLRHSHHHEGDQHQHHHGFDRRQAGRGGLSILVGNGVHNFADGVLVAAAFLADTRLGIIAAASVIAHEVPQNVGDFLVLLNAGFSKLRAYVYSLLVGVFGVAGGVAGYTLLDRSQELIPYALVIASASFIYIALSDLIPQMHREDRRKESFFQVVLMGMGLAIFYSLFVALGGHAH
jgi:zinc and cadmium transporter